MTLYLLNNRLLPLSSQIRRAIVYQKRLSVEEARRLVHRREFVSAIGHEEIAQLLSELLGVEVPTGRGVLPILREGDEVLSFLATRPDGKVTRDHFELVYLRIEAASAIDFEI
ncbi:MAG: DUF1874 domain-containing protein [Candidatus Caldarchaeum sp.]